MEGICAGFAAAVRIIPSVPSLGEAAGFGKQDMATFAKAGESGNPGEVISKVTDTYRDNIL